jgi:hypothetical protein
MCASSAVAILVMTGQHEEEETDAAGRGRGRDRSVENSLEKLWKTGARSSHVGLTYGA